MTHLRSVIRPLLCFTLVVGFIAGTSSPAAGQSEEIPLGSALPDITAQFPAVDGTTKSVDDLLGEEATVLLFWSNQCPWVDKYEARVRDLVSTYRSQGVAFVRVNSNDPTAFPRESLSGSTERAEEGEYQTPYVRDPKAALANVLGASRTPHVFVFDDTQTLVYAGTIDDSPADASAVKKTYLDDALTAILEGNDVPVADTKAFGCMIKFPS